MVWLTKSKLLSLALLLLGLLFVGVMAFLIWSVVHNAEHKMRSGLLQQIRDSSQTVNIDLLKTFSGTISDEDRPEYRYLKEKFEFAIQMNSELRYIYLTGRKPDQRVFFFMDTGQPEDREEEARPGDIYDDVPDEMIRVFDSNAEIIIGPYTDRWGTFISGMAPLIDPQTDKVLAVMGMDVDYSDWSRNVLFAAVPLAAVFVAALLVFITILTFLVIKLSTSLRQRDAVADALKNQKDRYGYILEGTDVGTWEWNVQTGEALFNERFVDMAGYALAELAPISFKTWENLAHPDDLKAGNEVLERHFRGETNFYESECRIKHKDGHWVWVLDRGKVISRTEDGKPLWVYGTHQDITERKRAEEALLESEECYRTILNEMSEGYHEVDLAGNFTFFNEAFFNLFGYSSDEMLGTSFSRYAADEAIAKRIYHTYNETYRTGVPIQSCEWEILRKDGERRTLEFYASLVRDSKGIPTGFRGIVRDITLHKQAEVEREKLQTQLNQAQKMESIGTLAGGIAHDFNNMLGVILGHVELVFKTMEEDNRFHKPLNKIQEAAQRSADLTRQLLAFARKQTISPRSLDLNDTVQGMLNLLLRVIGEDIDLAWEPGRNLCPVRMDPTQIDQILANLCVNARDAISGVGKVTIETDNTVLDEAYCARHVGFLPGEYVTLAVSDNGCGMNSETLSHLFEPFFTTKEVGKGTGLGLATVYGIVKQNNGFINVYSEPGQGTTVKIYLPCHAAQTDLEPQITGPKTVVRGYETILLVEDEPMILEMTTTMLEELGYRVIPAPSPGESIRLAKEHPDPIHLLMTDVVMPEMNGRDLAGQFTALYPDLKLLFMSGYTANVIAHQGILDEGVAFIQKPFSMADLAEKIREVLDMAPYKNQG